MKLPLRSIKKIGILRALQLGDMLCMIPAARALRAACPDADITLIGLPWAQGFTSRFHNYFDRFLHFPGYPGLPEQSFDADAYQCFVDNVRHHSFDLLIQMQGNGNIVNKMMADWGSEYLAGFKQSSMASVSGFFVDYPGSVHEIERHLLLMEYLGISSLGHSLEFPVTQAEKDEFAALQLPFVKGQYVVIHPGSRGAYRQWPPEHFASAAALCYQQGYGVVITGTPEEHKIVQNVTGHLEVPYYNACGKTGLGAAAKLIQDAALIVCNCTGVSHIASAMETPGIIISMDGEPERWGPMNKDLHITIDWLQTQDLEYVMYRLSRMISRSKGNLVR
jgi:ADP-heptose:LPS heptosyltransferase